MFDIFSDAMFSTKRCFPILNNARFSDFLKNSQVLFSFLDSFTPRGLFLAVVLGALNHVLGASIRRLWALRIT